MNKMPGSDYVNTLIEKVIKERTKILDLGCCGLTEIPERIYEITWLEELNLGNYIRDNDKKKWKKSGNKGHLNRLTNIPGKFSTFENLKILLFSGYNDYMDFSQKVHCINENALPLNLEQLDLSYNVISEIEGLSELVKLRSLSLSGNRINEIKGLDKLVSLNFLSLNENNIAEIKGLDKLKDLSSLWLNGNNITEIKGLDKLMNLSFLSLAENNITEIKGLDKLINLSSLWLNGNNIKEIKGLDKLLNLGSLSLNGNFINEIKGFDKLAHLSSLSLAHNKIDEIVGLDKLDKLEFLSLNYNGISEIKGLMKLLTLKSLHLSGNKIDKIIGFDKLIQLETLYLDGNGIVKIEGLGKLINLHSLSLTKNFITKIEGLGKLLNLNSLSLSYNQITEMEDLGQLENLHSFSLNGNKIEKIKGLEKLVNLQSFNIDSNHISEIMGLEKLINLRSLFLSMNEIKEIVNLEKLRFLKTLYLSGNRIDEIKGLDELVSLTYLSLDGNRIGEIKGLDKLISLNYLSLGDNEIAEIKEIDKLVNLESVYLNNNKITEIKGLNKLIRLEDLYLSSNQISEIKNLDKLAQLSSLSLEGNQIGEIKGLNKQTELHSLFLSENKIRNIKGLQNQINLTNLEIDYNQISEIQGLGKLVNLENIDLQNNKIKEVKGLNKLIFLNSLNLSNNEITSCLKLQLFHSLEDLSLYGNKIRDIPQGLLGEGEYDNCLVDIRNWWEEMKKSKNSSPNLLVKLQVLGNGNAGKSSIIEALKHGKCDKEFESTHGVLIEPVEYNLSTGKAQFQAWDFGGQEIYHGTHKLFISSESIQLIVTDSVSEKFAFNREKIPDRINKDELILLQPLEHFINISQNQSPSSIKIVVENKVDGENEKNINIYNRVASKGIEFTAVSSIEGRGIDTLRAMLGDKRNSLLHYQMLMPKSWIDVQNHFLLNLSRPYVVRITRMTKQEFEELCIYYKVLPKSISSLLKLLHHTGLVYANEKILNNIIIIDQRWALEAIYSPLDRKSEFYDQMRKDFKGRVRVKYLFKAFGDKYDSESKWLFLRFMQSCGLCFSLTNNSAKENDDSYYIFPEFLPENETPAANELWKKAGNITTYRYKLDYLDYYRIQKFIVDIGNKTKLEYIWKTGIVVITEAGMFKVEADTKYPAVLLKIENTAQDMYLWKIISTLSEGDDTKGDNRWTIVDDDGNDEFLNIEIVKRKWHEMTQRPPMNDAEKMEDERLEEKSNTNLAQGLKDVQQTVPKRLVFSYASEDLNALNALEMSLSNYELNGELQILYDKEVIDGRKSWDDNVQEMFNEADGFVLLVSQAYQFVKKKKYIWENEIPIIERRNGSEKIFTFCVSVAPVEYNNRIKKFASYKNGKVFLPESENARAQFCIDFVKEIIEKKFLKK